jgi:predicted DCC family thiol-disulfide oxidoreductase YuxK
MNESPLILFDGVCNLCCSWVQFLIRNDKREQFIFTSMQSDSGERILKSFGIIAKEVETVVYIKNNTCLQKSTAILEILTDLGGRWRLFGIFRLIPKTIRDLFYRLIASTRYKVFGKRESCIIPAPKIQKRFLT